MFLLTSATLESLFAEAGDITDVGITSACIVALPSNRLKASGARSSVVEC